MHSFPAPTYDAILTGVFDETLGYHVQRPHGTPDHLLFLTLGGGGVIRAGTTSLVTRPGDVALIHPGTAQDYRAEPAGWRFIWAHFHARAHWAQWLRWHEVARGVHRLSLSEDTAAEVERLLRAAHGRARGHRPMDPDLARAILEQALLMCAATLAAQSGVDVRIERAAEALARDPTAALDVAGLARGASLSASRFAHLFSEQLGQTPLQFHERLRMDLARRLLSATALSVKEVADACGFASPFYFSLRFKRATGKSPRAWRER